MCGIVGLATSDGSLPPSETLDAMLMAIAHRGPDGEGRFVQDGVALAQKRLAIIDLATGDQPLFGPRGTALVCNGEIYNYVELKREFARLRIRDERRLRGPALYVRTRRRAIRQTAARHVRHCAK